MKSQAAYVLPADAGYFTTRQWDSAFRDAFELLQTDARNRRLALTKTPSSKHRKSTRPTKQEASHVQVR